MNDIIVMEISQGANQLACKHLDLIHFDPGVALVLDETSQRTALEVFHEDAGFLLMRFDIMIENKVPVLYNVGVHQVLAHIELSQHMVGYHVGHLVILDYLRGLLYDQLLIYALHVAQKDLALGSRPEWFHALPDDLDLLPRLLALSTHHVLLTLLVKCLLGVQLHLLKLQGLLLLVLNQLYFATDNLQFVQGA